MRRSSTLITAKSASLRGGRGTAVIASRIGGERKQARCYSNSNGSRSCPVIIINNADRKRRRRHDSLHPIQPRSSLGPGKPSSSPSRAPVLPGKISEQKTVPPHIKKPLYAETGKLAPQNPMILLHGPESAFKMRSAGRLARKMLDYACSLAKPGVTTDEIDTAVHEAILAHSAYPSPLNYWGFPKSICSSINEVVIHGIPDDRPLQSGDIAKFDISLYLNGVHGDNCASVCVGEVDKEGRRLVEAAQKALDAGVAACIPGGCLSDIGRAIHGVTDEYGYSTVRAYSGHGVGPDLHMKPYVLHYRNEDKIPLRPGMIFTIEPMVNEYGHEVETRQDGWTVVTKDGGRGAQFEHTVLITEEGVEILTIPE